jgi:hypothetical protein
MTTTTLNRSTGLTAQFAPDRRSAAALAYAARGWAVLPCVVGGKEPAISRGFHQATLNPATIARLWRAQDYNIGVRTGAASGVWVLDVDGDVGRESLKTLETAHGPLPRTAVSVTRHGFHLWFEYNEPIPSSVARVAPGIDVRGDGGYCVAPPSVHPTGHVYEWTNDPSTCVLALAPEWLVRRTRTRPHVERAPIAMLQGHPGAYGQAALDGEIAILEAAPRGTRNNALNLAAFKLFQLVAGGELDREHVLAALVEACHTNGLAADGMRAVLATIRSAEGAGLRQPRSRSAV